MTDQSYDFLVLAPHATIPGHDGASVRSNELALAWMEMGRSVLYIAKHGNFTKPDELRRGGVPPAERSKSFSAFCALIRGVSYNAGKHVTGEWLSRAKKALSTCKAKVVYVHFLWTIPALTGMLKERTVWTDTHNFDPEWFGNMERGARDPLTRFLARSSARYSLKGLQALRPGSNLVHVTESDSERYSKLNDTLAHRIIPNGCRLKPREASPAYMGRKRLYFLGLLSARMNEDGLSYFAKEIWPNIKGLSEFFVVGKSPTPLILSLCQENGWTLKPNIPNAELDILVGTMHFSVMPFAYSAGSKTKLMDSAGRGIPILATSAGVQGYTGLPLGVRVLSTPVDWIAALGDNPAGVEAEKAALIAFASLYSWKSLAAEIDTLAFRNS